MSSTAELGVMNIDAFGLYMLSKARKDEAYANYCHASAKLELARIHERLAEIKSQHEPLAGLVQQTIVDDLSLRQALYNAAFYVAIGRMPEGAK